MQDNALGRFGEFVVTNFRDKAIEQYEMLKDGHLRAKRMQDLYARLSAMPKEQRDLVGTIVTDVLDTALHDVLFAIQDAHDRGLGIEVIVNGENIAKLSGMLHGEIQGNEGWIARFSRFPTEKTA
jgi:hypothetical protein